MLFANAAPVVARPGFCFTPEQDRLYALGWPHLIEIVDEHRDDKKPAVAIGKLYKEYFGAYHVAWPRLVARGFVRGAVVDWRIGTDAAKAVAANTGPVTPDEARDLVLKTLERPGRWQPFPQAHFLFALEAIVGTDLVLDALCDAFEASTEAQRTDFHHDSLAYAAYLTGYLLLRATPDAAGRARRRLLALSEEGASARNAARSEAEQNASTTNLEHTLGGALDLALHGASAAKRVLSTSHWQYLHFYGFVDDLAMLQARTKASSKSEWDPDARLVWLCGGELLKDFSRPKALRGLGKRRGSFLFDIGMFRDADVVAIMVRMIGDKQAKDIPARWFREHGGHAKPVLEGLLAGGGEDGEKARTALALV